MSRAGNERRDLVNVVSMMVRCEGKMVEGISGLNECECFFCEVEFEWRN